MYASSWTDFSRVSAHVERVKWTTTLVKIVRQVSRWQAERLSA